MIPAFDVKCPYCGKPAVWVNNSAVYGRPRGRFQMIWWCRPCDARVGCHFDTMRPLGTMANAQLRELRKRAHREIDQLWTKGTMTRSEMYARLSKALGHEVHVGWADEDECERIMNAAKRL